jgi:NADH dehydrogenase/NADH:ubiquinone oxidoreductase subunit G
VRVPLACAAAASVVALAGCGSSKPAYCGDRTNLENSIKGLTSLTTSSGVSGLKTQVTTIQSDAATLVSSAKSDFPSQTSAITSSVNALKTAVAGLSSSPSAAQIATVTKDAASVVSSVKSFTDATSSQCG